MGVDAEAKAEAPATFAVDIKTVEPRVESFVALALATASTAGTRPAGVSTRPLPSIAALTSELSSKHWRVTTGPQKRETAPKGRNTGGRTRNRPELSFL